MKIDKKAEQTAEEATEKVDGNGRRMRKYI